MEDLRKVNSMQLYMVWKNLTIGLMAVIALMTFSQLLPFYFSPIVALLIAAALYVYVYSTRMSHSVCCMIAPYAMLYGCVSYAFTAIVVNVLYAWGIKGIPAEFIFFNNSFLPALILNPVCFLTALYFMFFRRHISICRTCKVYSGETESMALRTTLQTEAPRQVGNLVIVFGVLSAIVWSYYLLFYVNISINARDKYVFVWVTIIAFVLDELYFIARYYNLYLDMKDENEIITQEELNDMTAKTYLRYYVICGNSIYVDAHAIDPRAPYKEVIDTPFFTKRTMNGIPVDEVKRIIGKMTGYSNGELRFFFGRKCADLSNHSILRYFYFLDGEPSDYPDINVDGEWMDYEKIKYLYSNNPGKLAEISVGDTTRLATIMLTEKTFDENGFRKSKIKTYNPSFNLIDVRKSNIDFQDDKWIDVSMFNSDTPMFRFKRWWRKHFDRNSKRNSSWR